MMSVSTLFLTCSASVVGLALSAGSGFDWGTDDDDDDYESPFADEADESSSGDESPEASDEENPFASASSDDPDPEPSSSESEASPETDEPGLSTMSDARALCDEAMALLHDGDSDRAFDRLSAHWAFSQEEMTELQREVERTRAVVADRYGASLDYRLVREDTTTSVLACFVYLERFEVHGLRWRFTFYEGADGWTLNELFFDDEIEALLV